MSEDLKPGRELDALVAEKVMGFRRNPDPRGMTWMDADGRGTSWFYTEWGSQGCDPFSPSTDIAAAWTVLERFPDYQLDKATGMHRCYLPMANNSLAEASADTAPHAICLAALEALKAVGA